ncbi:MAG: 4Fe-4S cluster-binding domain-containing protein [Chloroflexi bacterium]|nr:4Fe-4S cluster-binding domain-containing protein [Chloroflexota bacterium]
MTRSQANGPGSRTVVWTQGCTLGCPGCFNPTTHPVTSPEIPVDDLVDQLTADDPNADGLTVSGGEPLQQPQALRALIHAWDLRTGTGVIVLTGFTWTEITASPLLIAASKGADLLICGRYNQARHLGTGLRGSANKEYHFLTNRYSPADIQATAEVEVIIGTDGSRTVTGIWGSGGLFDHA